MKSLLRGWNFIRTLRLALGVIIIVQGIITKDIPAAILGFILGGMAVADVGCCGTNGCAVKPAQPINNKVTIDYEELDTIK